MKDPSQLHYEPGDHIGIYPFNEPKMVKGNVATEAKKLCF